MACEIDRIFAKSVPHILEKIFLTLDFKSFMNCLDVCKSWNNLLISETFQRKTKNVFWKEIHHGLNRAAVRGNVDVIQMVLSSFIVDINQSSSLYLAASFGKKDVVQLLLERGADPNIHVDVHVGRQFVGEQFAVNTRDKFLISVKTGNEHAIKLLIPKEAGTNMVDETGMTPLITTVQNGYEYVAQLLLAGGAEPDIADDRDGMTPLFIAAYKGYQNLIRLLLNKGADINRGDKNGSTPLYWAAQQGHKRTVSLLLEEGADPNIVNFDDMSPLLIASLNGYKDVIETLIANGADVNIVEYLNGSTPLLVAAMEGHKDVVQLLLAKGADPYIADHDGNTPQSLAEQNRHMYIVYLLDKLMKDPEFKKFHENSQIA